MLISPDDLESLEETLAILSDPGAMDQIHESELALAEASQASRLLTCRRSSLVNETLGAIASNPRRLGRPLRFELEGRWSARRGPYRIVYRMAQAIHRHARHLLWRICATGR